MDDHAAQALIERVYTVNDLTFQHRMCHLSRDSLRFARHTGALQKCADGWKRLCICKAMDRVKKQAESWGVSSYVTVEAFFPTSEGAFVHATLTSLPDGDHAGKFRTSVHDVDAERPVHGYVCSLDDVLLFLGRTAEVYGAPKSVDVLVNGRRGSTSAEGFIAEFIVSFAKVHLPA